MRTLIATTVLLGCSSIASAGTILFSDDFESYANRAALFAPGAWGDLSAAPAAAADLVTVGGNPGQYATHPGGATGRHQFGPAAANDGAIIWEFDYRDGGTSNNKRVTGGLRVLNGLPLLEMGIHNSNFLPETGGLVAGYAVRTVNVGGPGDASGWIAFPGNPAVRAGWHHFRATINPTSILFELDFNDDGTVDASRLVNTPTAGAVGWSGARFGGPSDVSSAGGGADFDNYSITQIPEPTTLALLALGGLALRRRG